jgi:hypothetical protein
MLDCKCGWFETATSHMEETMKLLSIAKGAAAAAILFAAAAGMTTTPSIAAKTCVVSLVKYLANACPPGMKYAAVAHTASAPGPVEPRITPTAAKPGCVKSLVKFLVNRCPG